MFVQHSERPGLRALHPECEIWWHLVVWVHLQPYQCLTPLLFFRSSVAEYDINITLAAITEAVALTVLPYSHSIKVCETIGMFHLAAVE